MFQSATNLKELDLSNFNTENVTTMGAMFQSCSSLKEIDVSSFDTSNVTNM
jgi:surface protein